MDQNRANGGLGVVPNAAGAFNPSGPPRGDSLDKMKQNYQVHCDKEYASHVCAEHPRTKSARDGSKFPRDLTIERARTPAVGVDAMT